VPKMSDAEIERLLSRNGLVRVGTITADGSPLVVPVGYLYQDGEILMTARARVGWLADIRRDPRVCLVIDDGRYPLPKITINGVAEIRHEPGEDDLWRDRRLPMPPAEEPDPDAAEWSYQAAYHAMTHDEPRALVAVPLATATMTSWRMPIVGEHLSGSWAARYYEGEPRRFRVVAVGKSLDDVKVVPE
jgi:general stress protein 26